MGTRHLIAVYVDGKHKIAQYCQWDGYPSGSGAKILEFLKTVNLNEFRERVRATRFLSDVESEALGTTWHDTHPQLSRDAGPRILEMVNNGVTELCDNRSFAGDSLFCEWAYVIDLDTNVFEVYEGFNKEPVTSGRFQTGDADLDKADGPYHPIKLKQLYTFEDLPSLEDFLAETDPPAKDDDEVPVPPYFSVHQSIQMPLGFDIRTPNGLTCFTVVMGGRDNQYYKDRAEALAAKLNEYKRAGIEPLLTSWGA